MPRAHAPAGILFGANPEVRNGWKAYRGMTTGKLLTFWQLLTRLLITQVTRRLRSWEKNPVERKRSQDMESLLLGSALWFQERGRAGTPHDSSRCQPSNSDCTRPSELSKLIWRRSRLRKRNPKYPLEWRLAASCAVNFAGYEAGFVGGQEYE